MKNMLKIAALALLGTMVIAAGACDGNGGNGGSSDSKEIQLNLVAKKQQFVSGTTVIQVYKRRFTDTQGNGATFTSLHRCVGSRCVTISVMYVVPANGTFSATGEVKAPLGKKITETYTGTDSKGKPVTANDTLIVQGIIV